MRTIWSLSCELARFIIAISQVCATDTGEGNLRNRFGDCNHSVADFGSSAIRLLLAFTLLCEGLSPRRA
jgi:hypothetical protein